MSLKAGRVGVNPADVDPISGHISPDATDSYTKSQADDKFLSKSDATSLQPKTLANPITLLNGSVLTTVEGALDGLQGAKTNKQLTDDNTLISSSITTDNQINYSVNYLEKVNRMCNMSINMTLLEDVTAYDTVIGIVPVGNRPKHDMFFPLIGATGSVIGSFRIRINGNIDLCQSANTNDVVVLSATYCTE